MAAGLGRGRGARGGERSRWRQHHAVDAGGEGKWCRPHEHCNDDSSECHEQQRRREWDNSEVEHRHHDTYRYHQHNLWFVVGLAREGQRPPNTEGEVSRVYAHTSTRVAVVAIQVA